MDKNAIYDFVSKMGIWYEITEHEAVFNMAELGNVTLPYPDCDAKNLFVRDDKKRNYYLITTKGDKRVDLKQFRKGHELRHLSFASDDDLRDILGLIPGAVTPLGVLNDSGCKVKCFIDEDFVQGNNIIGIHPNDNTATLWLKVDDLVTIIKKHGNQVEFVKI